MCLFRPELRKHGITEQQWRVLRALAHFGPMEVSGLAAATFLLEPSLSRILPLLEQRELITRGQVETDLRRSIISLAPNGLKLIAAHAPTSEKMYELISERFGTENVTDLLKLLGELMDSLEDLSQESSARRKRR